MSDFKPGTVARATYEGTRVLVVHNVHGWAFHDSRLEGKYQSVRWADESVFTDITPLVCLELTREDAERIDDLLRDWPTPSAHGLVFGILNKLRYAIREQTPAPLEIPDGHGAVVEDSRGFLWTYDGFEWVHRDGRGGRTVCGPSFFQKDETNVRVLSEGVTP